MSSPDFFFYTCQLITWIQIFAGVVSCVKKMLSSSRERQKMASNFGLSFLWLGTSQKKSVLRTVLLDVPWYIFSCVLHSYLMYTTEKSVLWDCKYGMHVGLYVLQRYFIYFWSGYRHSHTNRTFLLLFFGPCRSDVVGFPDLSLEIFLIFCDHLILLFSADFSPVCTIDTLYR